MLKKMCYVNMLATKSKPFSCRFPSFRSWKFEFWRCHGQQMRITSPIHFKEWVSDVTSTFREVKNSGNVTYKLSRIWAIDKFREINFREWSKSFLLKKRQFSWKIDWAKFWMGLESLFLFTSAGLKGKLQGLEKKRNIFNG